MGTYCQLVCKASGSLEHSHPPSPSSEMTSSVTSSRSLCLEQSRPGLPCPALGSSLVHFQYNKPSESLTTLSSSPSKQFFFSRQQKKKRREYKILLLRYLHAAELIVPAVCRLHGGEATFQIQHVLVSVFALLKGGQKKNFKQESFMDTTLITSAPDV